MAITVEGELGAMGPLVSDSPEEGFPDELFEPIDSIHQEGTVGILGVRVLSFSGWTHRVSLSGLPDNMGGTFNASAEASGEVEVTENLSSMVTQDG